MFFGEVCSFSQKVSSSKSLVYREIFFGMGMRVIALVLKWLGPTLPSLLLREGGSGFLGMEDLIESNNALNLKHIWHLFKSMGNSLWVNWVSLLPHEKKKFLVVKIPPDCAWYWRKVLKLRALVKPHFRHMIGNGENTYLWYNNWYLGAQ